MWVQVRRGKNPRQGESLDSRQRQRQNRQYNYEQARSTRHAGGPPDLFDQIAQVVGQGFCPWAAPAKSAGHIRVVSSEAVGSSNCTVPPSQLRISHLASISQLSTR